MTAQEMFEELGYKKDTRNLFLDWHKMEMTLKSRLI